MMPSEISLKQWIGSGKEQVVISEEIKWFQYQKVVMGDEKSQSMILRQSC